MDSSDFLRSPDCFSGKGTIELCQNLLEPSPAMARALPLSRSGKCRKTPLLDHLQFFWTPLNPFGLKRTYIEVFCLCHRNLAEQLPQSQNENVMISMLTYKFVLKNCLNQAHNMTALYLLSYASVT